MFSFAFIHLNYCVTVFSVRKKNHNEIKQRELLTTESSSTLTESLNGKNDMVDNSTIEKEKMTCILPLIKRETTF